MFDKPFSFQGRIRRTEYGISLIIFSGINIVLTLMAESGSEDTVLFTLFCYVPLLWFIWAQGAKRSHDIGNSGWLQLIPFYPLLLLFQDGEHGLNKYGENPKGITSFNPSSYNQQSNPTQPGGYSGGYSGGHNNHGTYNSNNNPPTPNYTATSKGEGSYKPGDLYK